MTNMENTTEQDFTVDFIKRRLACDSSKLRISVCLTTGDFSTLLGGKHSDELSKLTVEEKRSLVDTLLLFLSE